TPFRPLSRRNLAWKRSLGLPEMTTPNVTGSFGQPQRRIFTTSSVTTGTPTRLCQMHAALYSAAMSSNLSSPRPLIDGFGRHVTYLRVSVTDRCDFRCTYCMGEDMVFLPKSEVLSFGEIQAVIGACVARGVRKVRLTGGEPLVRRDIMKLIERLSAQHLASGALDELTLTTNGSQLAKHADRLFELGIRRINVSLDTLDAEKFAAITRRGRMAQ